MPVEVAVFSLTGILTSFRFLTEPVVGDAIVGGIGVDPKHKETNVSLSNHHSAARADR